MDLDLGSVKDAVEEKLANVTGLSVEEVAAGIHSIVNENMASATRIAEKGQDPRRYALVASGGAGPGRLWHGETSQDQPCYLSAGGRRPVCVGFWWRLREPIACAATYRASRTWIGID